MQLELQTARRALNSITARQRAVLDLVIEHRTSKEISRELGIAPNTVDQRINAARDKLGARDRAELARIYGQLLDICGETTCGSMVVDFDRLTPLSSDREAEMSPVFTLNDAAVLQNGHWGNSGQFGDLRVFVPENRFWRLAIIVGLAVGISIVLAAVLGIMNALNTMV